MENGFSKRMAKLSDSELENILAHRDDWQPEAVEAAKKEATKRNLLFSTDEQFKKAKQAKQQQAKQLAQKKLNVLIKNKRPQQYNHNSNNHPTINNMKKAIIVLILGAAIYIGGSIYKANVQDAFNHYYGAYITQFTIGLQNAEHIQTAGIIVAIAGGLWLIVSAIQEKKN